MPISNPQVPAPFPLNQRAIKITPTVNGMFGECGSAGAGSAGTWTFMWVPDPTFAGSLVVMGRIAGNDAASDGVPQVAIPYRASNLNGTATSSSLNTYTAAIVGTSLFQVDTAQLAAGLLIECTAGFGTLYSLDTNAGNS
jgi:hypothetical protein